MKKGKLLNSDIISVISKMGHTDRIAIADCGLPIPDDVIRIDLALMAGVPSFMETLEILLENYKCESYILANEIKEKNPALHEEILKLNEKEGKLLDAKVAYVSHEEFKSLLPTVKAVIRTGEATPYANIILESGVIF